MRFATASVCAGLAMTGCKKLAGYRRRGEDTPPYALPVGRHALMPPLLPLRLRSIAEACGGVRAPRPTHSDTRTAVISPRHLHFSRYLCIITAAQLSLRGSFI